MATFYPKTRRETGERVAIHILVAEKALGRRLQGTELVHHIDENPLNFKNDNLVICPDKAYHQLLHTRMKALKISGDADNRKCIFCAEYDSPSNMKALWKGKETYYHRSCNAERAKRLYYK